MKIVEEGALFGANGFTYVLAFLQTNEVFQYIELILGIITSVVLIAYRLWVWYNDAKEDGKITKDEVKDGLNILIEGKKDVENKLKKGDKDANDKGENRKS